MKALIEKAKNVAIKNFSMDKFGAPAQDADLIELLKGNPVGHPTNLPIMQAYNDQWQVLRNAWIEANFQW